MSFNTRTLSSPESVVELLEITERTKFDIMCLCETRMDTDKTDTTPEGHLLIRGARDSTTRAGGVGFLIAHTFLRNVVSTEILGPRLGRTIVRVTPSRLLSVYVAYCPTQGQDDAREDFYAELSDLVQTDKNHYKVVCGDFNGCIGPRLPGETLTGPHSADTRDEGGEELLEFAAATNLHVMNGFFQKPITKRWTHISPDGRSKREIDYFLTNTAAIISDVGVITQSTFNSDHRPLRARIIIGRHKMFWGGQMGPRKTYDYEASGKNISRNLPAFDPLDPQKDYSDLVDMMQQKINDASMPCPNRQQSRISPATRDVMKTLRRLKDQGLPHSAVAKDLRRRIIEDCEEYRTKKLLEAAEKKKSTKRAARSVELLRSVPGSLKKTDGSLAITMQEKMDTVTDFYSNLFQSDLPAAQRVPLQVQQQPHPFSSSEIEKVVKGIANRRAPGEDRIPVEVIKAAGPPLYAALATRYSFYMENGWIPNEWRSSKTTLLYKKGPSDDLANYRPISLLSILYKIFTKAIYARVRPTLEEAQPVEQAGFRTGFNTMDHIHSLFRLVEVGREYHRPLVLTFVDYQKAFDSLEIPKMLDALTEQKVEPPYVNIISEVYKDMTTKIKLLEKPVEVPIGRGVRQGDPLSPALFSAALEQAMRDVDWTACGIDVSGRKLSHLRFADDLVFCTETPQDAEEMLKKLDTCTRPYGLRLNLQKTVVMRNRFADPSPVMLNNQTLPEVDSFIYLGRELNMQKELGPEILRRQQSGWAAFNRLLPILKSLRDPKIRGNLFDTTVLSAMIYASETWAFTEKTERKLRVTQGHMMRRLLGMTIKQQRDRGLHNSDLRELLKMKNVVIEADHRKHTWAGHVARRQDGRWTTVLTSWTPPFKRPVGRPPIRWADSLSFRYATKTGASKPPPWPIADALDRPLWRQLWDPQLKNGRRSTLD